MRAGQALLIYVQHPSTVRAPWLYEIVDVRYGSRLIILTSNRAMSDWMGVFPDPVIAGAILACLTHHAHQIQLKGESIRKKLGRTSLKKPLDNNPHSV